VRRVPVRVSRHISLGEEYCWLTPRTLLAQLDVECRETLTGTLCNRNSGSRPRNNSYGETSVFLHLLISIRAQ
jgi:hypothetical protein